jgi:hypothetical protein
MQASFVFKTEHRRRLPLGQSGFRTLRLSSPLIRCPLRMKSQTDVGAVSFCQGYVNRPPDTP